MNITATFRKKTGLLKQDQGILSVSFQGDPELVSGEYNELKKRMIKLGYEVE